MTGVLTVIGGWFLTAMSAFIIAALVATVIHYGGFLALLIMIGLAGYIVWRMHGHHQALAVKQDKHSSLYESSGKDSLEQKVSRHTKEVLGDAGALFASILRDVAEESKTGLKKAYNSSEQLRSETAILKLTIHDTFKQLSEHQLAKSHYYVKAIMYLRKMSRSIKELAEQGLTYVENHHPRLIDSQVQELGEIQQMVQKALHTADTIIAERALEQVDACEQWCMQQEESLAQYKKHQLERIKSNEVGVRNSTLYLGVLDEAENILIYIRKMLKAYKGLFD
ncbi:MAG: hypothetical protein H6765_03090 [Candidatus Peribacteria bacterium]|nr:MAG: hypothetical protein H6765_03090 [Candidatus Peribacteria bacterium]